MVSQRQTKAWYTRQSQKERSQLGRCKQLALSRLNLGSLSKGS